MGGCSQKWACDSNFNKWINLAEFLHANTYLRKLSYFNNCWVGMVKYVISGHRTLKSAIPQPKNKSMN